MASLPLIVFDVNETLLDLRRMEPTFERIFGDKSAMRLWFANLILYSAALTVAGCYVPFTDIGSAVMKMLADTQGIKIDHADEKELTENFSTMPPYPEVPAALRKLRNAGFRLFTLTDNLLFGNDVLGVGPQPQIIGKDLNDVAAQLIARVSG
jgi:2-haloacid dehalogenase